MNRGLKEWGYSFNASAKLLPSCIKEEIFNNCSFSKLLLDSFPIEDKEISKGRPPFNNAESCLDIFIKLLFFNLFDLNL